MKNKKSLFIFRRDLRLEDNIGLIAALKNSEQVIPCFIFDPRQCEVNSFKSDKCLQFMIESLIDLQQQLSKNSGQLFLFHGICEEVVENIILEQKINAIYFNNDYTPFSRHRDDKLAKLCQKHDVKLSTYDDALLVPPQDTLKLDGTPYKVFTAFYNNAKEIRVDKPLKNKFKNYYQKHIKCAIKEEVILETILPQFKYKLTGSSGGRTQGLKKLKSIHQLKDYAKKRDHPYDKSTSLLSPHLKFTTCSIREIYHTLKETLANSEALVRQLYWRDFYTMIAYYHPYVFGQAFQTKFNNIQWKTDKKLFRKWCEGKTGFPIVDAGMRQLNETGYMHNRARLITASFLIKDLHINWLWGEKYFAQKLVDYDPALNNGNWQWVAGTGTDAAPYFRIFNPWLQQLKFDVECLYIKEWLPELRSLDKKVIHNWYKSENHHLAGYPSPIVDHKREATLSNNHYRSVEQ